MILTKDHVDEVFDITRGCNEPNQGTALVLLYRCAFPNWDKITKLDGWPRIGNQLHRYIMDKFRAFDREYHPDCMEGGAWFNSGFGTYENEGIGEWEVSPCGFTID